MFSSLQPVSRGTRNIQHLLTRQAIGNLISRSLFFNGDAIPLKPGESPSDASGPLACSVLGRLRHFLGTTMTISDAWI
jgi:hypothetical protein